MSYQFKGQIQVITPEQTGISKSTGNEWCKQEVVIVDFSGQYARKIVIEAFNKRDEISKVKFGQTVIAHFNTDASEFNGRWYGKNTLWKFELPSESNATSDPVPAVNSDPPSFGEAQRVEMDNQDQDGLPF